MEESTILERKTCKKFLERFVKTLNGLSRHNIEPIVLIQIAQTPQGFEPVIINKPFKGNIFNYVKALYSDKPEYKNNLEYMDMSQIKVKKDEMLYEPIIITSFNPVLMIKKNTIPISGELIIPEDSLDIQYSNSYFLVIDLFKNFIKEHTVHKVNVNMEFFDDQDCKYDTSAFLYANDSAMQLKDSLIKETSPIKFLPVDFTEEDPFMKTAIKQLLVYLNIATIQYDFKELVPMNKVIFISEKEKIQTIIDEAERAGTYYIDVMGEEVPVYGDFFPMQKYEFFGLSVCTWCGVEGKSTFSYAGLVMKTKDYYQYYFYKYYLKGCLNTNG